MAVRHGAVPWLLAFGFGLSACLGCGPVPPAETEPAASPSAVAEPAAPEPAGSTAPDAWEETVVLEVPSAHLDTLRPVSVRVTSLPGMERDALRPVIFVMDGGVYHGVVSGFADAMARRWSFPGLVVVGVPHARREIELSSARHGGVASNPFYRFLADELTPFLAARFPVAPHRSLLGYSSGGAFALAAWAEDDGAFQAFVVGAPPPIERLDDGSEIALLPERFNGTRGTVPRILHLGVGALDQDWFLDFEETVRQRLEQESPTGVEVTSRRIPGRTHNSAAPQVLIDGLSAIFGPWELPISYQVGFDAEPLRTWSARHKARFGFDAKPPLDVLVQYGMGPFFDQDYATALPVFEATHELYPASAIGAWYLASILRGLGRDDEALAVATAAFEQSDPGRWRQRLETLLGELRQVVETD